jgi:hypothetical protein
MTRVFTSLEVIPAARLASAQKSPTPVHPTRWILFLQATTLAVTLLSSIRGHADQGAHRADERPPECLQFRVGTHNDALGYGWGPVPDDFRTFGFETGVRCGGLALDLEYSGFTNRGYQAPTPAGRVDELVGFASFRVLRNDRLSLSLLFGGAGRGDLGGEELQNALHRRTGHPVVTLPYEETRVRLLFGLDAGFSLLDRGRFRLDLLARSWFALDYGSRSEAGLRLRYGLERFALTPSVRLKGAARTDSPVMAAALRRESGLIVGLRHQLSLLYFAWETNPATGYARGDFGLRYARPESDHDFRRADLSVDLGAFVLPFESYFTAYSVPARGLGDRLALVLTGDFGKLLGDRLPQYPDARGDFQQFGLGSEVRLFAPAPKLQFNPYARTTAGVRHDSIYRGEEPLETLNSVTPVVSVAAGLRITTPWRFLSDSLLYGINVFYRYTASFNQTRSEVLGEPLDIAPSQHFVGAGFAFTADL